MFGTLFEGMGNTKVRSLAQSRNLTNKDDLKLGSHGKSRPSSTSSRQFGGHLRGHFLKGWVTQK